MILTSASKLGAVQRLPRQRLLDVCRTPREKEALQSILHKSDGETFGEIRSDLVELTDRKMKRFNRVAATSLGLGLSTAVLAGILGRPWLATALAGAGVIGAGGCLAGNLSAFQQNSDDLGILLAASGRALKELP